ncbi:2-octaprenyl-6-methoxyphenyl hydroxylase [Oceanobacter sp. 5_MG-2023]|uniref:2-octaprenyl-6-methoxyphenyl hydroxylase n=1 Tax=Oceanobacter sp. 5_MG-2023 TaxID=3062645 RepID=UPI0026E11F56|nr:2-octaprenyl-6-methoxyphenyl hydroxylase [Oceanobacter sp. 5_MG-2023]MDO6680790.1 2-octaprenyl-6-methoxyphenyl hydroxylase [Oceanobacter sp. 5_MG-2023]
MTEPALSSPAFDLVILGAGMTGASLVHLLQPALDDGLRIALIDRQQIRWTADILERPPSFDGRATALAWGSRQLLERMGCWSAVADRACAIEHIQASDRGRFGQTHLHASEQGTEALGYIVENAVLGRALLQGLDSCPNVTLLSDTEVTQVTMTATGSQLTLADGKTLTTALLVMADGGRSGLAQQLGIRHQREDYGRMALVTQVEMDREHQHWAYERFSDHGPVALLPLQQRHFAVVWTLPPDDCERIMALPDALFAEQLQQQVGYRSGRILRVGERFSYPLALVRSGEQVRRGLVLLGNAAHSLHPVAGQGFNLALRDTAALAARVLESWSMKRPLGDLTVLLEYAQQQQQDQANTILASDLLPRVFSHPGTLTALGRGAGLLALASLTVPRRLLARHAMGLGQPAPRFGLPPTPKPDNLSSRSESADAL